MKSFFTLVGGVLLALAVLVGLGWVLTTNQLGLQRVFAPKFEEVRRDTFETSKAYRDGMAQELTALQVEYLKADDKTKPALAALIKHKAAGVPAEALPPQLNSFIRELP